MAEPSNVNQFVDAPQRDTRGEDLEEFARSRAERGEGMSPDAAAATKGWDQLNGAQRALRAEMLRTVDPALAAEARGYIKAGYFGDVAPGQAKPIRDIDEWGSEAAATKQGEEAKRKQAGRGSKQEEPGVVRTTLEKAKEIISKTPLAGAAGLAAQTIGAVVPPLAPVAAGAAVVGAAKGRLEDNAQATTTDEKARLAGSMQAPPSNAPPPDPSMQLIASSGGGDPGPTVIEPGVVNLHGSGTQTTQIPETPDAKRAREEAGGFQTDAIVAQGEAERKAGQELLNISKDREAINERFRVIEEQRRIEDEQVRKDNERRIQEAERAFEEAEPDPKWNPYREVANGSWDQRVMLGLGSMLGAMGAVATKGPNLFLQNFDNQIQRRMQNAEAQRRHRGEVVKGRKDGYSRALEALGSKRALDLMEEARMWKGLEARIEVVAKQMGLDSVDPRVAELLAGVKYRQHELMMKSAQQITRTSQQQQAFKPIVVVPGGGGGGKDPLAEGLEKVGQEREKKKLPQIEGALNNMNAAIQGFAKDPSMGDQIAVWLATGKAHPALVQIFVQNPQALQSFLNGYSTYRESVGGKALTESEIAAIRQQISSGNLTSLRQFYQNVESVRNSLESDVRSMFPGVYDVFAHNKGVSTTTNNPSANYQPNSKPLVGGAPAKQ